jgi:pimeloyl-ACP methyl ester carboxylesterase
MSDAAMQSVALPPKSSPYVITLVHGTYGGRSTWTRSDSALCRVLSEELGAAIVWHRFMWSGRNSLAERVEASRRLRSQLEQQRNQLPSASHYVIGHSHGGGIAYHAIDGLDDKIDGVVCLSTPFLTPRYRPHGDLLLLGLFGFLTLVMIGAAWAGTHMLSNVVPANALSSLTTLWLLRGGLWVLLAGFGGVAGIFLYAYLQDRVSLVLALWPSRVAASKILRNCQRTSAPNYARERTGWMV